MDGFIHRLDDAVRSSMMVCAGFEPVKEMMHVTMQRL